MCGPQKYVSQHVTLVKIVTCFLA